MAAKNGRGTVGITEKPAQSIEELDKRHENLLF